MAPTYPTVVTFVCSLSDTKYKCSSGFPFMVYHYYAFVSLLFSRNSRSKQVSCVFCITKNLRFTRTKNTF